MNFLRTFVRTRKRVRQRATRYSLLVVVTLFSLFLEAYMHNFNLVYITLFFVFAAAFSAGPVGILNLGRLQADFDRCGRLFADQPGQCFFRITNPAAAPAWAVELHCGNTQRSLPRIAPFATLRAALEITPKKRGRVSYGACTLQSLFPLSTVRFIIPVDTPCAGIVYPAPEGEPLHTFLLRRRARYGDEEEFDGLTRYSGVESISRIHWPSVAKGEPSVKTFNHLLQTERLEFDFASAGKNDEARLRQLCLWVLECEAAGHPFAILMPGKLLLSDREEIDAILEHLALF